MGLEDRLFLLFLGGVIGYVIAQFEIKLNRIQEEVHEMDEIVKNKKDEGGFATQGLLKGIALFLVVMLSFVASVKSQISDTHSTNATNQALDATRQLKSLIDCNQKVLNGVVDAANDRSTYSVDQIKANVDLQSSFSDLLDILLHQPPFEAHIQEEAVNQYHKDQKNFVSVSKQQAKQAKANAWPEKDALSRCIARAAEKEKNESQ